MSCRISLQDQHLLVEAPYLLKDACKAIAGARWQKSLKAWAYPPTPSAARALHLAFPNPMATWTEEAAALLIEAEQIADAAAHKTAENLPPIPLTKTTPWPHQLRGFWFAKDMPAVMLALDMGCIAGDSVLHVQRGGAGFSLTAKELFLRITGQATSMRQWNSSIDTYIRGRVGDDRRLGKTRLLAAFHNGLKPVVILTLNNGRSIRCTADHEIVTPLFGKVHAEALCVGEEVLVQAPYSKRDPLGRFQPGESRRRRIASRPGYVRLPQTTAQVVSVIPAGVEEVFDFTVESEHHDYIANGIVVGNTGKSKVTVDLMVNNGWQRVLILCPKSVVQVWPAEVVKHAAVPIATLPLDEGSMIQRTRKMTTFLELQAVRSEPAIVILNYDAAWREPLAGHLLRRPWDAVICDESHRIKAPGGKAAMFCSRLGDVIPRRLCLTGTPMPHSPLDAYAQYRFLDKGIFGTSFVNCRARYAVMGGFNGKQVLSYQNQDELHEKFYSIAYRVKSEDVQSLPEAIDVVRPVILGKYARDLYTTLKKDFVVGIDDGTVTAGNALTRLLRLQQIGSGWVRQDRDIETGVDGPLVQVDTAKQEVLADLLEDLADDEPIVVFCRFHHDLDAVHTVASALARRSLELSGRRNELADWQSGAAPILAVQIQSGGVGINLVRARYCVFYSLGFSLGEYLQARKRTHRPGQDRAVTYFHLIATKTVDEDVYAALEARQDVIETILTRARG